MWIPGTTCFSTPSFDCLTDTKERGGSIPFVAFEIWADVSDGISAIKVELRIPVSCNCVRKSFQGIRDLGSTNSSTSFLYVSIGKML